MDWIDLNPPIPYGPIYDAEHFPTGLDSLDERGLARPGVLIDTEYGVYLIGHISPIRGQCDCCADFSKDALVKRYAIVWEVLT